MPSQPPQAQLRSGDGASRRHCPTLSPRGRPSSHLGSWAPGLSVAPPEVPSRWPGQHSQGEGEDALGGGTGEKKARDIASAPPPPRQTPTPPLRARKGFPSSRHPGRSRVLQCPLCPPAQTFSHPGMPFLAGGGPGSTDLIRYRSPALLFFFFRACQGLDGGRDPRGTQTKGGELFRITETRKKQTDFKLILLLL